MTLDSFPVDVQKCSVQIISSWPATAIALTTGGGISCGPQVVGEYNIKYENETSMLLYEGPKEPITQASFTFYMQREMGPLMNAVIIPCMMLFVVGYSSMFLTAQPARAAFAIITILSNLKVMKAGRSMMPVHSGNIWLDDWLSVHLFMAFIIVIANVLSFHHCLQIPKLTPEDEATGEITCLLRLQKMSKGVLPSANWVDFSMQRMLPIVYVLAVISMFIKLGGIAQGNPASAYSPPVMCVPATDFETAGAAQAACDAAAAALLSTDTDVQH